MLSRDGLLGIAMLMNLPSSTLLTILVWAATPAPANTDDTDRWLEILGPARGRSPESQEKVVWRDDLAAAMKEARDTGRPLFVTLRCLPCKQCAGFDAAVLEGGPALDLWLKRFITVRITDARDLDLRLLPVAEYQDLDLSWWGWFLSPGGRVYGVFGGRDHVSDTTRISVPALMATLERVLRHHSDPRRAGWDVDGPAPDLRTPATTPERLPGYARWTKKAELDRNCLHCHQVADILRQDEIDAGRFDARTDLEPWPLPENVGIELDRDHGLRVSRVETDSPAARAGVRPGDELAAAGGRRLFSQTDFRGVLHRADRTDARLDLIWLRDGKIRRGTLETSTGWKRTELSWRMSVSQGNVGAGPSFWPNAASRGDRARLGIDSTKMALRPWFGPRPSGPAYAAGLRPGHVVTAVGGESPNLIGRPFMVWFRLRHEPGDEVLLDVLGQDGSARTIRYSLPAD